MMTGQNRLLDYEAIVQRAIDTGQKIDGSGPIGDLAALEKSLNLSMLEQVAFQNAQASAHARGVLRTGEAQIVYQSISAGSKTGWAEGVSLARKITVTNLIGQLIAGGRR